MKNSLMSFIRGERHVHEKSHTLTMKGAVFAKK